MAKEKIKPLFDKEELEQLSFIYQLLDKEQSTIGARVVNPISSRFHQTNRYVLQLPHKPISKIIDWSLFSDEQ